MATPSLLLIPDRYKSGVLYSQLPESGAGDIDFTRASAATRVNASGLIESVASGVPRLDYTGGGCPSLLLEPQRTNLALFSEQFDNAAYVKADVTISANATDSPDGTQSADKIIENTANDAHAVLVSVALASGTHTYSFFAKASERSLINVQRNNSFITAFSHDYNLAAGTASGGGKIEPYANGFFRCSGVFEVTTASTTGVGVYLNNGSGIVYTGDGTSGVFAWGWQYELGSYVSSYIPTLGSSVTRLADAASKTAVSGLIGQTEGTIFWEIQKDAITGNSRFQLSDGTTNNWLFVSVEEALRNIRIYAGVLSGTTVDVTSVATLNDNAHKIAFAYAQNDFKVYVDGVDFLTNTSGDIPACSRLDLGNNSPTGAVLATSNISAAALYPTRLSNTELAALTAL
jgi:hypothetical protein